MKVRDREAIDARLLRVSSCDKTEGLCVWFSAGLMLDDSFDVAPAVLGTGVGAGKSTSEVSGKPPKPAF